jgi:anti-sigma factor RsiW
LFSCDEFRSRLSDLVDDETARSVRLELERHLAECRTCRVLYDSTRKTIRVVTDAGSWEIPEEVSKRLAARILSGARKR